MEIYFDKSQGVHHKPENIVPTRRLSAYAIVQNEVGKLLMVQPTWGTVWELPGGGIELEESIQEGIVREFVEETGYAITVDPQPLHVGERNYFSKMSSSYFKSLILVYRGKMLSAPAPEWKMNGIIEGEISKIDWIHPSTLTESSTHPIFWPAIKMILA